MLIKFKNIAFLKALAKLMKTFGNFIINIEPDRIIIRELQDCRVLAIDVCLKSTDFVEFHGDKIRFDVSCEQFYEVIRKSVKGDIVSLRNEGNDLFIEIESKDKHIDTRMYNMPIEVYDSAIKLFDWLDTLHMNPIVITEGNLAYISELLKTKNDMAKCTFTMTPPDTMHMEWDTETDKELNLSFIREIPEHAKFSLIARNFKYVIGFISVFGGCTMKYNATDAPIEFDIKPFDGDSYIKIYQAPAE